MRSLQDSFFTSVSQLMGARAVLMLIQFLSLPVLARLLTLEDFAIASLGMAIPLFASTFSDAGFGRSLVRVQTYDHAEWSSVFWFLVAVGASLALIVILAAPVYARIMNQPDLLPVVMVLALVPMLQAISSVHQASIERSFRFDVISGVLGVAGVVSVFIALGLALLGYGYWALVIQQVLLALIRMIGVFWLSSFRPAFVFKASSLKPHIRFGTNTLLFSGVMTIQNQAPVIAFNQMFGTVAVSLWSMAERVSRFPIVGVTGPLAQVAMVSMSRQWRDGVGAANVGRSYISATRLLASLMFPGILVLAFNGRPVFTWLLSEPWGDIALIFALAAPAFMIDMVSSLGARVFMVADRTDLRLRMAVERFVLGITIFLAALPFGVEIAILARSLFVVCYLPRYLSYMNRCVPLSIPSAVKPLVLPAAMGLLIGVLGRWVVPTFSESVTVQAFVVLGTCILASALCVLVSWPVLREDITWLRGSTDKSALQDAEQ